MPDQPDGYLTKPGTPITLANDKISEQGVALEQQQRAYEQVVEDREVRTGREDCLLRSMATACGHGALFQRSPAPCVSRSPCQCVPAHALNPVAAQANPANHPTRAARRRPRPPMAALERKYEDMDVDAKGLLARAEGLEADNGRLQVGPGFGAVGAGARSGCCPGCTSLLEPAVFGARASHECFGASCRPFPSACVVWSWVS